MATIVYQLRRRATPHFRIYQLSLPYFPSAVMEGATFTTIAVIEEVKFSYKAQRRQRGMWDQKCTFLAPSKMKTYLS